jgi:DNA-binding transcriptional LysR family regulator
MEMQQLRYFLAAARELNFTRAATQCNVSQPSLTRAIGLLETELGGDLFRRERNLTHLTDLGTRMLPLLTQAVENADQASELARSIQRGKVATLRLALPEGVALEPFVPHMVELPRAFPAFDIRVLRGSRDDTARHLKEGDVDMLLGPKPEEAWDRYESWPLYGCTFSLVFRADHPLARKDIIRAADLGGTCVLHRPYCWISVEQRAHLTAAGVVLSAAPEFARDEDLLSYLSSSPSVAFLPSDLLPRAGLTSRRFDWPTRGYVVHATTVFGRQRGAALSLFLTQLRAAEWQVAAA